MTNLAVWNSSNQAEYNRAPAGMTVPWLSKAAQARVERVRQGRMILRSQHRQYYLEEGRTQFDYPPMRVNGVVRNLYLHYNLLGLISLKGADLILGEAPTLSAMDARQQDALKRISDESNLQSVLYQGCVCASYCADAFFEGVLVDNRVYVRHVPSDEVFPVGSPGPDGQHRRYDRITIRTRRHVGGEEVFVVVQSYLPGQINTNAYRIVSKDKLQPVDLSLLPEAEADAGPIAMPGDNAPQQLQPVTTTGITMNTMVWMPNMLLDGVAVADYDGVLDLQEAVNAKFAQLARVLAKHSDPKLAIPEEAFREGASVMSHDAYAFRSGEEKPSYITWNAELDAAMRDRDHAINSLLIMTETSPALLGLKQGAAPDAYKKVRLEAINTVQRGQRKALCSKAAVTRLLKVAQQLDLRTPMGGYPITPISVEFRDGLPPDEVDQASMISTHRAAGTMSRRRALTIQLSSPAAVQAEMEELDREASENRTNLVLGDLNTPPSEEPGEETETSEVGNGGDQ